MKIKRNTQIKQDKVDRQRPGRTPLPDIIRTQRDLIHAPQSEDEVSKGAMKRAEHAIKKEQRVLAATRKEAEEISKRLLSIADQYRTDMAKLRSKGREMEAAAAEKEAVKLELQARTAIEAGAEGSDPSAAVAALRHDEEAEAAPATSHTTKEKKQKQKCNANHNDTTHL